MEYNYNENTLFHSINYNFAKLESILQYGILSESKVKELNNNFNLLGLPNISYTKNYEGSNTDKYISATSYSLINENNPNSSYNLYTTKGISFIIEDIHYLVDKEKFKIHRDDEVLVEGIIPPRFIKGLTIPENDKHKKLSELTYIPLNATKYESIKSNYEIIEKYLKEYNYTIPERDANNYLKLINLLSNLISTNDISKEDSYYKENYQEYRNVLKEFNHFIASHISNCFNKLLNKECTPLDVIEYILKKNNQKLEIYNLPTEHSKNNQKI